MPTDAMLNVFEGLPMPAEYAATMKYAVLAKSNGGKTYLTLKLEEQMCDLGMFFVTLDPVGKHWALRAGKDGSEKGGKDVFVLGGQHGDVTLEPRSGELIADTVIEHPGRYVLDVSGFDTDADQDKFALDFAVRLFRRKAKDPGFPLLLILEEAESFIPQQGLKGTKGPMLGAFGRIARQGRNHGLGLWMVAQRSAALNKGVLSQADVLIAKEMSHKRDRDAVDDWVESNGTKEERDTIMASLASLKVNEAWVWSPSWLRCFERTVVLPRTTFDSSASVRHGESQAAVTLTPLDVGALGERIAATAERAKAEDPKELRRQIRELRAELGKRPTEKVTETVTETVEVPVLKDEQIEALRELVEGVGEHAGKFIAGANDIAAGLRKATGQQQRVVAPPPVQRPAPAVQAPPRARPEPREPVEPGDLTPSLRKILDALAMLETFGITQPSRVQVAVFVGESHKGGAFNNKVSRLRTMGYLEYPQQGLVTLTEAGHQEADAGQAPGTVEEMHHLARGLVGPARARILDVLIARYPDPITREDLAAEVGEVASGGAFNNKVSRLRSLGLADYPQQGWVAAAPVLFLEAAAA